MRRGGFYHGKSAVEGDESRADIRIYDSRLMRRIVGYLKPQTGKIVIATLLLVLFSALSLIGPLITSIGIDHYIANGDREGLLNICILWFALLSVTGILQYVQIVVTNLVGQNTILRLRKEIYSHLQKLPIAFFDKNPIGRLVTRATNDVEVLNQVFTQGVVSIIGDVFALLGIVVLLAVLNLKLALITYVAIPVLIGVSVLFRRWVRTAYRQVRLAIAKINTYVQESLNGIALIKSFQREDKNEDEFAAFNLAHREACIKAIKAFAVYFPVVELIQSVTIAGILWFGGREVIGDTLTFGALVAFIQYVGRFFRPIRDLSDKFNELQDAFASSERIFSLLDEKLETQKTGLSVRFNPKGIIRFEDVHSTYDGVTPVLKGVSLEIPAGKTTAIVGPTGAGKTTMVSLLFQFYKPSSGRIVIDGIDIKTIPPRALRQKMAIVQQEVFLFSGTIEENICLWGNTVSKDRLGIATKTSNAEHFLRRLPKGLATPVFDRGSGFSTGERQLLAIARALAFDPDILILDEATASVDSETEALIQEGQRALLSNRTAIVIAHRLSTIRSADQIIVLQNGEVAERGTHGELIERKGIYARLNKHQFGNGTGDTHVQ